ncbi:MAG TPA: HAD family phosphatase [Polyangia bacterium]|jgi:HAD superfamily hydrolase (TIGR01509 family)
MPAAARVSAFLFDLDGLVADSEPHSVGSWRDVLATRGVTLEDEVVDRILGLRPRDSTALIIARYGLPDTALALSREKVDYQVAHLAGRVAPMPGLARLLDALDARRVPRAIASSGARRYVTAVLATLGLEPRFPVVVTGDEVTNGKPAPDIFLRAAALLGVPPAACVVLEDAPNGVAAALAAGMRCFAVPNGATRTLDVSAATWVVASLDEVADRVDELVAP